MYTGEDIKNKIAERKLNIIKGFVETDDILEKAKEVRQVGQTKVGSDGVTRVWTQLPNGKYDWRRTSGKKHQSNEHQDKLNIQSFTDLKDDEFKKIYGISKDESLKRIKEKNPTLHFKIEDALGNKNKKEVKKISSDTPPKLTEQEIAAQEKNKQGLKDLADPSKAYRTTSARSVKHKTIKDQKHVDNIKDVYKLIDRHLNKISNNQIKKSFSDSQIQKAKSILNLE